MENTAYNHNSSQSRRNTSYYRSKTKPSRSKTSKAKKRIDMSYFDTSNAPSFLYLPMHQKFKQIFSPENEFSQMASSYYPSTSKMQENIQQGIIRSQNRGGFLSQIDQI
jgi:hypothetical protein